MNARGAEQTVIWLLQEAETEACGLRASAWNHAEEAGNGSGGGKGSPGGLPVDRFPDHAEGARSSLRRAWGAFQELSLTEQAVLRDRYKPRGPNLATVPGFGEWSWVGESLPQVRRRAEAIRTTPHEALRDMVKRAKDATLLEQCKGLVNAALDRYGAELAVIDAASEQARLAGRDRLAAEREGRGAA